MTIIRLSFVQPNQLLRYTTWVSRSFLYRVIMVFAVVGALDFFFQRFQWKKKLKMSKDEIKQEYKEMEGDPYIKSMRKSLHKQMVNTDVPRAVAGADVVTVNPTRLAVAVQYDRDAMVAPKVVAKGQKHLAKKIIQWARKANVPVIREIQLTRLLFDVDVDDYIPEDLYETVAEILLFAWKLRRTEP